MLNPLTIDFWRDEERRLWEELEPLAMAALLAGATGALRVMPAPLEELVDFDFVNRAAQRYLSEYRLGTVANINRHTREAAVRKITDWMRGSDGIDVLKRDLRPLFGKSRADVIAQTESVRIIEQGHNMLYQSTGVVAAVRWVTVNNERTCPLCRSMDGKIIPIGGSVNVDAGELARAVRATGTATDEAAVQAKVQQLIRWHGTRVDLPPRHPNCHCFTLPVVDEGLLRREIGDILAQDVFSKVAAGQYDVYIARGETWRR